MAQKEETPEVVDVPIKHQLNPALRRFVAINNTTDNYLVTFTLVPKSANFMNFRMPTSVIQVSVKPSQAVTILTIAKLFPEIEWGEYDQNCMIQKIEGVGSRVNEDQGSGKRTYFNISKTETA